MLKYMVLQNSKRRQNPHPNCSKSESFLGKHKPLKIREEPTPATKHKHAEPKKIIPDQKGRAVATVQKFTYTPPPKPTPKIRLPNKNEETKPMATPVERVNKLINSFAVKHGIKRRNKCYGAILSCLACLLCMYASENL